MNINELDQYRLSDAIRFHDRLNPRLWDEHEQLRPEVREKLLAIAANFQEFLGVEDLDLEDITISGSNAAYSYTPHSDIDLHLIVRMPEQCDDVYKELFNAKKYQYNDLHDIRIRGADVELYVQPSDEPAVSLGEYSILNDKWLQVPRRKRAHIDQSLVRHKYDDVLARVQAALADDDVDRVQSLVNKIKDMRRAGLAQHGEFGPENLVFKMLRTQGWIQRLYDRLAQAQDQALSLKEKKKEPVRYGFRTMEDDTGMAQGSSTGDAGAQSTWDGVSPDTQQFLNESPEQELLQKFIETTAQRLGIQRMPQIHLHQDSQWSEQNHSFGRYDPDTHELHVSLPNRHMLDVLRTTAHELAHCRQNEISGGLPADAGETGSDWENEAHAVAGIVMRDFADANPQWFEQGGLSEDTDDVNNMKWPGEPIPFPKGTVKVGVSDVYDWYKLGQQISDLDDADPRDFGQGAPQTVLSFGSEPLEHEYMKDLKRLGMPTTDIDEGLEQIPRITRQAIAAACVAAGVSGCATVGDSLNTTRDVARLAQQIQRTGRAGMQEELTQELKNYARARGGDATAQNQSILYRKEQELREGGWDNPITQNTKITPATVKAALPVMRRYVKDFNAWSTYPPTALGHPTGSSAYYQVDDADTEYGDIDLQIVVPELPETQGLTQASRQGFWNRLWARWIAEKRPAYVNSQSEPGHPILKIGAQDWVQVDLMPHTPPQATWGRYRVTPERGTKGLLNGNMFSVLGQLMNMSIQHGGVEYKERDGVKQPYTSTRKNYVLKSASNDIERFILDILRHEYQLITGQDPDQAQLDPLLVQNPGVDVANPNIQRLARGIQGLARSFEINNLYGQGDLQPYASAQDFLRTFLERYNAKSQEAISAAKFDKATTPDAQARAQRDKERIAQGTQRVNQMFDLRESSGYIPTEAEKKDPRFVMALTQDVQPGETGRQANKLGLKTDSQGRPALLRENQLLSEIRMSPSSLGKAAAATGARAGMEFEMCVPGVEIEDEDRPGEPDYSQDQRPDSIREIHDFFFDGDHNSRRQVDRVTDALRERYEEARDDAMREEFDDKAVDLILDALRANVDEDELIQKQLKLRFSDERAQEIMDIAAQGGELDPAYRDWQRARDEVEEELTLRAERSYRDEDEYWDEAWDQFHDGREQLGEDDWLGQEGFRTMQDVQNEYDQWLSWPYYSQPEGDSLEDVANSFGRVVPAGAVASSGYHDTPRGSRYVVEPDGSISADIGDGGVEFISPPMPIDDLMQDLDSVVEWAKRYDCYTNSSTGLHINVSVPGLNTSKLDYIKLALLLGDEYVLDTFGRLANTYTRSALEKIRNRVASLEPEQVQNYFDLMREGLAQEASRLVHGPRTNKYTSINVRQGWIEFRAPGGDWLKMDIDQIKNTLLRMVVALDAAVDPNKYRQEYLKKFSQLMTGDDKQVRYYDPRDPRNAKEPVVFVDRPAPGLRQAVGASNFDKSAIDIFVQWSTGNLPQTALKTFIRQHQLQRQNKKQKQPAMPPLAPAQTASNLATDPEINREIMPQEPLWYVLNPATGQSERVRAPDRVHALMRAILRNSGWHSAYALGDLDTNDFQVDLMPDLDAPSQPQQSPARPAGGEWTGRWLIRDANTGQVLHQAGGIGNVQADANRFAQRWLQQTGFDDPIEIVPEYR